MAETTTDDPLPTNEEDWRFVPVVSTISTIEILRELTIEREQFPLNEDSLLESNPSLFLSSYRELVETN